MFQLLFLFFSQQIKLWTDDEVRVKGVLINEESFPCVSKIFEEIFDSSHDIGVVVNIEYSSVTCY